MIYNVKILSKYNRFFLETLRLYPPGFLLTRKCSEPYTFAGTNVTIPKDTLVIVPTFAMYRDPCIFPKPDEFNPERFADEAIKSRNSMSFIPFGDGPRMCLGKFDTRKSSASFVIDGLIDNIDLLLNFRCAFR